MGEVHFIDSILLLACRLGGRTRGKGHASRTGFDGTGNIDGLLRLRVGHGKTAFVGGLAVIGVRRQASNDKGG